MAEPDFTPQELDRLEDALDNLGASLDAADLSPALRERLGEYQELLNLSLEALPPEDAPEAIIAAVLAQAEQPPAAQVADVPFWTRIRRAFLLPTVALAGSVAAVLLIIRSDVGLIGADKEVAEDGLAAREESRAPSAPAAAMPAEAADPAADENLAETRRLGAPEPEPLMEQAAGPPVESAQVVEDKKPAGKAEGGERADGGLLKKKPSTGGSKPSPKSMPAPKPAPAKDAEQPAPPADTTWTAIADADAKRRGNRCGLATITYRKAKSAADPKLAARGHAGLGLCAERGGDDGSAHFARARKLDRAIDSFIRDERARAYRPGGKASKRKAKSNADALDGL